MKEMMPLLDRYLPVRWRGAAFVPAGVLAVHQLRYPLRIRWSIRQRALRAGARISELARSSDRAALRAGIGVDAGEPRPGLAQRARQTLAQPPSAYAVAPRLSRIGRCLCRSGVARGPAFGAATPVGLRGCSATVDGWRSLRPSRSVLIALVLRGASAAERWAASRSRSFLQSRRRTIATPRPLEVWIPRPEPLASEAAGRAPPRVAPIFV